jgi:Delta3-Delta2-enoyl-CoA isomerase
MSNNFDITKTFSDHPKILITALNGPTIGLSAALVALSDFIYAMPHAFLLTPFSSLGLVAEGGASAAFVQRLGPSKANEALIMSKRITAEEMLHVGFINKIITGIDPKDGQANQKFMKEVLKEVDDRLGEHLNSDSLLKIKALLRAGPRKEVDEANAREVYEGMDRFMKGVPQEEFRKVASGEKKHKL